MLRTFVAVEIAPAVRERATALCEQLRAGGENIKWVAPENMHLTLNFLGDVEEERVDEVCCAVAEAAATRATFEIELGGAGAFPSIKRMTTIWLGLRGGTYQLADLQAAIETALAGLGFPREWRPFTPHLTLGRLKRGARPPRALGEQLKQHADFAAGVSQITEVVIFSSELAPGGPTYRALGRGSLQASPI